MNHGTALFKIEVPAKITLSFGMDSKLYIVFKASCDLIHYSSVGIIFILECILFNCGTEFHNYCISITS